MSITDRLANRLGKPAASALDAPIRETVQAVLKEHGYASPAEVQALRDEVRDARRRADSLEARLARLEGQPAPGPDPRVAELEMRLSRAHHDLVALREQVQQLEARPTVTVSQPAPAAAAPLSAEPRGGCKVEGCAAGVRSKGFCSPHYQQWRRGTLPGFVGPEGTILHEGKLLHVPSHHAGGSARVEGRAVFVDGVQTPTVQGW